MELCNGSERRRAGDGLPLGGRKLGPYRGHPGDPTGWWFLDGRSGRDIAGVRVGPRVARRGLCSWSLHCRRRTRHHPFRRRFTVYHRPGMLGRCSLGGAELPRGRRRRRRECGLFRCPRPARLPSPGFSCAVRVALGAGNRGDRGRRALGSVPERRFRSRGSPRSPSGGAGPRPSAAASRRSRT